MQTPTNETIESRKALTTQLGLSPYNASLYLQRAACHEKLGYPDLAAGDAYRALLLTDEVADEGGEYHEVAVEALEGATGGVAGEVAECVNADKGVYSGEGLGCNEVNGVVNGDIFAAERDAEQRKNIGEHGERNNEMQRYQVVAGRIAQVSYEILARALLKCGDLKAAFDFAERGLRVFPNASNMEELRDQIRDEHQSTQWDSASFNSREDLSENGSARREIYPWNDHEPDRFSEETLAFINTSLQQCAPKCEVRSVELPVLTNHNETPNASPSAKTTKQLGIFTTAPIAPHEPVLLEPSILTASTGLHSPLCDACSSPLPPISPTIPLPSCPSCPDTIFCSPACCTRALTLYHPSICGLEDYATVAKDPSPFAATNALYTLLLARTLAMAETQNTHPLDLPQIKYLWGDYTSAVATARRLPFTFTTNIAAPTHLLASLSLDLFAPRTLARYDTWVTNTLLAKFRGVANARMDERTGVPEVAGVHWCWSLANHCCVPNVRWEWGKGGMGFVARGGEGVVRWGGRGGDGGEDGIAEGEELLNHYCDVELGVRERREWAIGALGGVCVCRRCVWEEREEKKKGEEGDLKN
ncbi:hypothetical protein MMC21_000158 [Puttea exsequens]|nr:hypothetical protein [Puttea exsequens]